MNNIVILLIIIVFLVYINNSREYFKQSKNKNKRKLYDKVQGKKMASLSI
jgi:hypothetical protein